MATTSSSSAAPKASSGTEPTPGRILINGVKAIADVAIVPGSSLIADGNVKSGALHAVGGILAGWIFGPIGWLAVGADAFSQSVSGKHIHQHFVSVEKAAD
jgi:hypothetical protein